MDENPGQTVMQTLLDEDEQPAQIANQQPPMVVQQIPPANQDAIPQNPPSDLNNNQISAPSTPHREISSPQGPRVRRDHLPENSSNLNSPIVLPQTPPIQPEAKKTKL